MNDSAMGTDPRAGWRAGAASTIFSVPNGTALDGYLARTARAVGTRDPLSIAALLVARRDRLLALIAADVVAVDHELVAEIVRASALANASVFICASHTHSGPAGVVPRLHPSQPPIPNATLRAAFVAHCVDVIHQARAALEPATLHLGQAAAPGVAANRNTPGGTHDDMVTTITARRTDGSPLATLVHFACHPTIFGPGNLLVSADFPGALRRDLGHASSASTASPVVLFANGAAGDVSTRFTRRAQDATEVERLGGRLATAALAAIASSTSIVGGIRLAQIAVALPSAPPPAADSGAPPPEVDTHPVPACRCFIKHPPPASQPLAGPGVSGGSTTNRRRDRDRHP